MFSDGSTDYESIGTGSCAAVLLPLLTTEDEILSTEAFCALTDNIEAKVRGLALALDMAIHYFSSRSPGNVRDKLFILCDCLSAINIVLRHDDVDSHINVSERVRSLLHTLNNLDVDVTLGLIPGHSDIYYNDLVDSKAKTARHTKVTQLYHIWIGCSLMSVWIGVWDTPCMDTPLYLCVQDL